MKFLLFVQLFFLLTYLYFYYLTSSLKADTEIFTHILSNLKNTCYGSEKNTKSRP